MDIDQVYTKANDKMKKVIDVLTDDFAGIRAGRANPAVLDKVMVDYYGAPTPINQLAAVSVKEARILTIQPWDPKTIHLIEKAMLASVIGINPQNDGQVIRLIFPALTEDRRKEIVKEISKRSEEAKIAVRNVRHDCMDDLKVLKKNSEITEDDMTDAEEKLQKITDKAIKNVEDVFAKKQKEIMEI